MLEADGYTPEEAKKAVKRFLWKEPNFFGRGWKIWITWFKPGFHPWDHDNRALMADWQSEFSAVAAE
jgi:predicted metal-dependent hydrolase